MTVLELLLVISGHGGRAGCVCDAEANANSGYKKNVGNYQTKACFERPPQSELSHVRDCAFCHAKKKVTRFPEGCRKLSFFGAWAVTGSRKAGQGMC